MEGCTPGSLPHNTFACCPGRPYRLPFYLHFTPLICKWQQPDYRPLHEIIETQYSGRAPGTYSCPGFPLGNKCPPAADYRVVTTTAVLRYPEARESVEKVLSDPLIDDVRVIVRSQKAIKEFLKNFRANPFFGKTKPYVTELTTPEFIRRWLWDQRVVIVE